MEARNGNTASPVEYDENERQRLGLSREHPPLSQSEDHGCGPGHVRYTSGAYWSWGENLIPDVPGNDLQQAHFDVMRLASCMPGPDLTDGFYLADSAADESSVYDPAQIVGMIESLGYAYWRAKFRMAMVGREFAESAGGRVMPCPRCPEAVADSAHAAVVRLAELLLGRIQEAIAWSTTGDYINQDNYYTVLEVLQWGALREFACSSHGGHRELVDEYQKAANRRADAPETDRRTESQG